MRIFAFVSSVVAIFSLSTSLAQEVPYISDDPVVNKKFDPEMFEFISKTLGAGKLAPHLQCTLKTRNSRELRKFSKSSEWVEILEIDFNTNGFDSGLKMNFKIPITAKYGVKKSNNQWSGLGEDIKIDLNDFQEHWIKFTHDGQGRVIQLMMGDRLRDYPCQVRY